MITINRPIKITLAVIAIIMFGFLSFGIGIKVGARKAMFTGNWYEGYRRDFVGQRNYPMMPTQKQVRPMIDGVMNDRELLQSNSVSGSVISVGANSFVVKTKEGVEKTVSTNDKTVFRKFKEEIKLADITVGSEVVAIGSSDEEGRVLGILVRIMR